MSFKATTDYEWKKLSNTAKSEDINLTVSAVIPPGVNFTNKVAQNQKKRAIFRVSVFCLTSIQTVILLHLLYRFCPKLNILEQFLQILSPLELSNILCSKKVIFFAWSCLGQHLERST